MDTTTSQWPQGIGVVKLPMEVHTSEAAQQRNNNIKPKPQKPQAINCPRCNSAHTKFCYYNNYSLTQPRYFCKTCRRYWTAGGSLRNVPVGGGSRKNKRSSSSTSSLSKINKIIPDQTTTMINSHQNPNMIKIFHEGQDLNLAYPPITNPSYNIPNHEFVEFPHSTTTSSHHFSQFLKSSGRGFSSFMSMIPNSDLNNSGLLYSSTTTSGSGLPFQESSKNIGLNFSLNQHQGFDNPDQGRYRSSLQQNERNNAKLFFPFEDLKQQPVDVTTTNTTHELMDHNGGSDHDQAGDHQVQSSGMIWNGGGGLGGGGGGGGGASW